MRSMVEGARRVSTAPRTTAPHHAPSTALRAVQLSAPAKRGRMKTHYVTFTFIVLVVSLPRMSMTLTTTVYSPASE